MLPTQRIAGFEHLTQPSLRLYVKFVFFEESQLQSIQFRDLEEYDEEKMKSIM